MKKGFILMETIVVISVLSVLLVTLYASYSKILTDVNKQDLYDNTEYIYKASIVRNYLEDNIPSMVYEDSLYYTYCNNFNDSNKCYGADINNYQSKLFGNLGAEAVYFFKDLMDIDPSNLTGIEPTTLNYIKSLDLKTSETIRLVIMFKDENNDTDKDVFQYANISFESLV